MNFLHQPELFPTPSDQTLSFIERHAEENATQLALQSTGKFSDTVDLPFAFDQIAGRRIAKTKLPYWFEHDNVYYPAHLSMEQCSSQTTAHYKANVARRLMAHVTQGTKQATTLVDLTGGFGVDCTIMASSFDHVIYVEQQPYLASLVAHNMRTFALHHVECYADEAQQALKNITEASLIFIDPARRDTHGNRTYAIADCTPNVLTLQPALLQCAPYVMVKLSPMLDWRKAVADFQGHVESVHILSVNNECKELLLVVTRTTHHTLSITCVNNTHETTFYATYNAINGQVKEKLPDKSEQVSKSRLYDESTHLHWQYWAHYLCEPHASIMKAGCFRWIEQQYQVRQLSPNSHLFISETPADNFPGKIWRIEAVCGMNKKETRRTLADLTYANVATRNFPMSAEALRKRLQIKDGGTTRIIGTTDDTNRHILIRLAPIT